MLNDFNFKVEKAILASMIFGDVNLDKIFTVVKSDFFFLNSHKVIFEKLEQLYQRKKLLDISDVNDIISNYNNIADNERLDFEEIRKLSNQTFISLYIDDYIFLLLNKYVRRSIINLAENLIQSAHDDSVNLHELLLKINTQLNTMIHSSNSLVDSSSLDDIFFSISQDLLNTGNLAGLKSGFKDLDYLIRGFQKSDLIIIAARPSIGKTALALNFASNIARNTTKKILFFSLEMSNQQLFLRLMSNVASISRLRMEDLRLNNDLLEKIRFYSGSLSNIIIDDFSAISVNYIEEKLSKYHKDEVALVIIDYLQLMVLNQNDRKRNDITRAEELSRITRSLKIVARNFHLPIVLLSQVSRAVEARMDKRPLLSDLKDSGCLGSNTYCLVSQNISPVKINKLLFYRHIDIWSYVLLVNKYYLSYFLPCTNIFSNGTKPLYQYSFYSNKNLELSANHRLWISEVWRRLDKIREFDFLFFIICIVAIEPFPFSSSISFWKFELLFLLKSRDSFIPILDFIGFYNTYDLTIPFSNNMNIYNVSVHNSIEQDADLVLMLYRESYYNQNIDNIDETELIITKHRNGPLGTVRLSFDPVYMNFTDYY